MTRLVEVRTARMARRCGVCLDWIKPGQRYERTSSTPDDDIYSTGRWDHFAAHAPYGVCQSGGMTCPATI